MDCSNCGAPLPAKSNICTFCKTLNEADFRTLRAGASKKGSSPRDCPRCRTTMHVVKLAEGGGIEVDRCETCFGIFFDPGELEATLERSEASAIDADRERLDQLIEEERKTDQDIIKYVPCPDCGHLMNRKGYGPRAGVVMDRCKEHGIWLDGGELAQLVKWARAGGRAHAASVEKESERLAERKAAGDMSVLQYRLDQLDPGSARRRDAGSDFGEIGDVIGMIARWLS
jgi:Zn-finger nucleic acid-binding protein